MNNSGERIMTQLRIVGTVATFAIISGAFVLFGGCSSTKKAKEVDVTANEMSELARATMNRQVGAGRVEKITREVARGKTVYDVEATVNGEHMEYLMAGAVRQLLDAGVPLDYRHLPAPGSAAPEKHFGTSTGLTAMKGTEYGQTHY